MIIVVEIQVKTSKHTTFFREPKGTPQFCGSPKDKPLIQRSPRLANQPPLPPSVSLPTPGPHEDASLGDGFGGCLFVVNLLLGCEFAS